MGELTDQTKRPENEDFLEGQFDPQAVALLNELLEAIDAQIVLTSSWRSNFDLQEMNELFSKVGICRSIISYTPNLNSGHGYITRGNEILKWCLDNESVTKCKADKYEDYLILDDHADFLLSQSNNFFQTDAAFGLTAELVEEISEKYR